MEKKNQDKLIEMEEFLKKDVSYNNKGEYILAKSPETVTLNGHFKPFKVRELEHPVSATATLMHFLKSCLGTGILAMPFAFKCSGLVVGVIATVVASIICTHCAYILVVCAHELYHRSKRTTLTFADVAEQACLTGPPWAIRYATLARRLVDISIFVTYFGTCSAYAVIISKNFDKVTAFYWGSLDIRYYLTILLIPLLILVYVPNLKYFAPVSVASNILMASGIMITCYYLIYNLPNVSDRQMAGDISEFPTFFSITIFSLEAIGIVMPLENNMKKPEKFIGICGVLNKGMCIVTVLYTMVGFLGYLHFGDVTKANITLNLPKDEYLAQAVQILIGLAIYGTFGLPFFVSMEILWNGIKQRYQNKPVLANYILRTALLVAMLITAIAVPSIGPFIGFIGALCFSFLGIMMPILIEIITFWEKGCGAYNWKILKNIVIVIAGLFTMIFGTKAALQEIIDMYR